MKRYIVFALLVLLAFGILTIWIPARWAPASFQVGAYWLGIVWIGRWIVRNGPVYRSPVLFAVALATLWPLIQLATGWTVYRSETWNYVLYWTANFVLYFVALQVFTDSRLSRLFVLGLLWFGLLVAIEATFQKLSAGGKIFWVFPMPNNSTGMGPFLYKNQYAAFIELLVPISLVGALHSPRRRLLYSLVTAALYASVILSVSRAGAALVTAELLIILTLSAFRREVSRGAVAAIAMTCLALSAVFTAAVGWEGMWKRFQEPDIYQGRREMLYSSLDMIRARPVTGFGLGTWPTVYPMYAYYDDGLFANQAHNDWAQWAAEGGLPFGLLMLFIAVWSARKTTKSLWALGISSVFLHCTVDYPLQKPALAGLLFTLLAVLSLEKNQKML
jgi:O-antigen ligase